MPEAVIVDAVRTPIGRAFKGSLKDLRPDETAAFILDALLERNEGLDPKLVEDVYMGCGLPQGLQANNIARIAVLLSERLTQETNGVTVSRYCASSLESIRMAANNVIAGQLERERGYDARPIGMTMQFPVADQTRVNDPLFETALRLEEIALSDDYFIEKKLYPNVDFYSGIVLRAIGFPVSMFTPLFAVSRTVGWIAQWKEMIEDPGQRIGRPRQLYTGAPRRVLRETSRAWVERWQDASVDPIWLKDGSFIWASERSGCLDGSRPR